MSRQDANAAFARTSFLYGGNADYIENLYARYENDPQAVDAEWQAFFQSLKDDRADVLKSADGPSWQLPNYLLRTAGAATTETSETFPWRADRSACRTAGAARVDSRITSSHGSVCRPCAGWPSIAARSLAAA